MWIAYALLSALFAGITAVLAKVGIQKTDSTLATALRTIIILAFAWLMVFVQGVYTPVSQIQSRSLVFLALSGLATGASWLCYFKALQLGDVNKVVPIDKSSTVLTMLLAFVLLGEGLTLLKLCCAALILAGTYFMIERKSAATQGGGILWILYAVLSAVFASFTAILGKLGIEGINSTLGTALRTVVVLFMAWGMVLLQGNQKDIRHIDERSMLFIVLSGLATGASWLFYYKALQSGPASVVVPIDKLSIAVTMAFAYFILKEKFSQKTIIGLAMILLGTVLLVLV